MSVHNVLDSATGWCRCTAPRCLGRVSYHHKSEILLWERKLSILSTLPPSFILTVKEICRAGKTLRSQVSLESCHLLLVALNAPLNSSSKRCSSRWGENCCRRGGGGTTPPHKMQTSALLTLPFTAKNMGVAGELQEPFVLPWPCHQTRAHQ